MLSEKDFRVELPLGTIKSVLLKFKNGNYTSGEVIDKAECLTNLAKQYLMVCKHKSDLNKVNEFLLRIRKKYWEIK